MSAFVAEIIGTAFITLFGCGVVASIFLEKSKNYNGGLMATSMAWAIGVTLGIYASSQYSGAHLNPVVTISLAYIHKFSWYDVPYYILAQFIGAMLGSLIVFFAYYPHWILTKDADVKLAVFATGPGVKNVISNFICEFIATFLFMFSIMIINYNDSINSIKPLITGGLIVGLGLSFGGPTGYAMNPARDLGPRIMHAILPIPGKKTSNWQYAWIPVVAPVFGGLCGTVIFLLLSGNI